MVAWWRRYIHIIHILNLEVTNNVKCFQLIASDKVIKMSRHHHYIPLNLTTIRRSTFDLYNVSSDIRAITEGLCQLIDVKPIRYNNTALRGRDNASDDYSSYDKWLTGHKGDGNRTGEYKHLHWTCGQDERDRASISDLSRWLCSLDRCISVLSRNN